MFCEKCGGFIPKENLREMLKTKQVTCPKCGTTIMSLMIGDRIPQKKPENTAIEIIPHRELEITETISINCPFCGYGRGYSEIIKTGFGDEGDVFVLYCGKCGKAVRREGGPVGWG